MIVRYAYNSVQLINITIAKCCRFFISLPIFVTCTTYTIFIYKQEYWEDEILFVFFSVFLNICLRESSWQWVKMTNSEQSNQTTLVTKNLGLLNFGQFLNIFPLCDSHPLNSTCLDLICLILWCSFTVFFHFHFYCGAFD